MLPIAVMKADLWRYCVIYKYGGIYADADTVCKINPKETPITFKAFDKCCRKEVFNCKNTLSNRPQTGFRLILEKKIVKIDPRLSIKKFIPV